MARAPRLNAVPLLVATLLLAGCTGGADPQPSKTQTGLTHFPPGIYYLEPDGGGQKGRLQRADGEALPLSIDVHATGHDLRPQRLAWTDGASTIHVQSPKGTARQIPIGNLTQLGRLSSAPEYHRLAVAGVGQNGNASVFLVDVRSPQPQRLSPRTETCTAPQWLGSMELVAFTCRTGQSGAGVLRIADAASRRIVRNITDAGTQAPSSTSDGNLFLQSETLRVYDSRNGSLVQDLLEPARAGATAAGFKAEGAFAIAGALAPDGSAVVFEARVEKDSHVGRVLLRIGLDGDGFSVLTTFTRSDAQGPLLQPRWLGAA